MTSADIARRRLHNQRLARTTFERPCEVVGWLGAVQAQDYLGALWAVGLRTADAAEADVEQALAERTIVRTWPMRGTLHFVPTADVRWMLRLLTPRVVASNASRLRQLEIDGTVLTRSRELFVRALSGGRQLSRAALYRALEAARISTAGQRGLHILSQLAQDGLICFGVREGRQQTFALLDEWAPQTKTLERDEALAELAGRYFASRGPATLQDFAWWSGLTTVDARAGLEMARAGLLNEVIDGQTYWLSSASPTATDASTRARLLPVYDEYTVAYKDRRAVLDPAHAAEAGNGIFRSQIVVDGRIKGTWKRTLRKDTVVITPSFFTPLDRAGARAVAVAAERYGRFVGLSARLQ
jgi:hypothetical protein